MLKMSPKDPRPERLYRQLFECAPEGFLVIGQDERITLVNLALAAMLGMVESEMVGRDLATLSAKESLPALRTHLDEAAHADAKAINIKLLRKEGGLLPCRLKADRLGAGRGWRIAGTLISVVDMTDVQRENAEKEAAFLERMNRQTYTLNMFMASVAHEIRSPLNVVVGMTELVLMSDTLAEQNRVALQHSRASAKRLCRLVKDLMDFARIEAGGELELIAANFDLRELVAEVCACIKDELSQKELTLEVQMDEAIPPLLLGDALRIYQVLGNLLCNAVKFSTQGKITLSAHMQGNVPGGGHEVQFSVSDEGPGIPEDKLETIFEAYRQVAKNMFCRRQGVGLGLAISRALVARMGGRLDVASTVGKGSCFHFALPLGGPTADIT